MKNINLIRIFITLGLSLYAQQSCFALRITNHTNSDIEISITEDPRKSGMLYAIDRFMETHHLVSGQSETFMNKNILWFTANGERFFVGNDSQHFICTGNIFYTECKPGVPMYRKIADAMVNILNR